MIRNRILFVLCVALSFFETNAQSLIHKIPLEEQVVEASLIVEGKVIEKNAYFSSINNRIYTVNKIQVFRVFKGEEQFYVNVVTKGGSIGLNKQEVKPSLQLRENTVGVFFLEEDSNQFMDLKTTLNTYHAYSGLQGFYKYDEYKNLAANPFYSFTGIQDVFYTKLLEITNKNKELVDYSFSFERQAKGLLNLEINSLIPQEVRSGTGETVTITGVNFGESKGTIQFKNADNGGATFEEANDSAIQSWSNTSITVRVPSFAGTGKVEVITNDGSFIQSDNDLTVLSAELNSAFDTLPGEDFRAKLYDSDRQGGYTWTYNESFFDNTDAVDSFQRAVDAWVCATNISWLISDDQTAINGAEEDGVNLVTFKSGSETNFDEIDVNTLAVTITYYKGCQNGDTVTSYVDEVDMIFNADFNWYFEEGIPNEFENDFEGTATHELGHAHNLGHVIAPTNLMHFETASGPDSATTIDEDSEIGAELNYEFSKTSRLCGQRQVFDRACGDYEKIEIIDNENLVTIVNPIMDDLSIEISEIGNIEYSFLLYDMKGTLLKNETLFDLKETVSANFLRPGIYVAKIILGDKVYIQKLVK